MMQATLPGFEPKQAALILRPYQERAIVAARERMAEQQRVLIALPTGTGKTIIFSRMAEQEAGRVLILAHRDELIQQAVEKLTRFTKLTVDVEKAERYANTLRKAKVVVSSIQTQASGGHSGRGRMHRFRPDEFSLVVVDEAHRATAKSYAKVLDYYAENPSVRILGVTATPRRHDKSRLIGEAFHSCAYNYPLIDAIDDGWLVGFMHQYCHVKSLNFDGVSLSGKDYNQEQLQAVMGEEAPVHRIASTGMEIIGNQCTLVFCAGVGQSIRTAEIFNRHRPGMAAHVDAKTPDAERVEIIRGFKSGAIQVLCNVGITTEGFDHDRIAYILMAHPTRSWVKYCQMVGRGTRPLDGLVDRFHTPPDRRGAIAVSTKPHVTIVDFVGNGYRHDPMDLIQMLSDPRRGLVLSRTAIHARARQAREIGVTKPENVLSKMKEAARLRQARENRERAWRSGIKAKSTYTLTDISRHDHQPYIAEQGMEMRFVPASQQQVARLKQWNCYVPGMSSRDAQAAIRDYIIRQKYGLCTPAQGRVLKQQGFKDRVPRWKANEILNIISANKWHLTPEARRTCDDIAAMPTKECAPVHQTTAQ